jgi:tetratricopeptide (TPR) repeat protein
MKLSNMRHTILTFALAAGCVLSAQQQQPKPKSQKELEALQKVQTAAQSQNPDEELKAINYVLENFADTDYKIMLLTMGMEASQSKGDSAQASVFGERLMEADPNNIPARVLLAEGIAQRTRENDLDKEQSLKKVEEYANKALELLKNASAAPAGTPEAQWPEYKKQLTSQAYDALGQAADLRKNYPDAIKNFQAAAEAQASPVVNARLAKAYVGNKQYDEAISTADKVLAGADTPAAVKQYAQQQKDMATKLKGSGAK